MKFHWPNFRRLNWWGFTWQIFLLTVLPLTILVLVVAFGSQSLHHDAMRSLVGDRDLKAVRAAANSLEQEIMHRVFTIQMLGREMGSRTDFGSLSLNNAEISANFDGGIALFAADGSRLVTSQPAGYWEAFKNQLPDYFGKITAQNGIPVISAPFQTSDENLKFILVGTLTGDRKVLVGAFTPAFLVEETIASFVGSDQTTALVITRQETGSGFDVLYRAGPDRADEHMAVHPGIKEVLNGESGMSFFHSSEGEHVVAYTTIQPTGWGLVTEEAWEDIASPSLNTTQSAPLLVVPLFLLAILSLWFGARRIVRPLQALENQAAELANGDFEAIHKPVGGIEEIRNLQAELIDMANKLEGAQQSLRGYIGAFTTGVENERRSLARELHDDTIQSLIALNQRIQLAGSPASAAEKARLDELQELVKQTITNLRRLIRGLRPIYLEDLGLPASLEMLAQEASQSAGIPIAFTSTGEERRLDPQVEMSLYRIVQEGLSNISRHSQASQAWIELHYTPTELSLEIKDNGQGFSAPAYATEFPTRGHFGLLGMHERAEIIGADLKILSKPGQGTRISVHYS